VSKDDVNLDNVSIIDHVTNTVVPLRESEQLPTHSSARGCGEFKIQRDVESTSTLRQCTLDGTGLNRHFLCQQSTPSSLADMTVSK
jgi:hypothetical protein